ncbi:hypothetical protein BaRGS_00033331, partial [Batillaria attramentaria]
IQVDVNTKVQLTFYESMNMKHIIQHGLIYTGIFTLTARCPSPQNATNDSDMLKTQQSYTYM